MFDGIEKRITDLKTQNNKVKGDAKLLESQTQSLFQELEALYIPSDKEIDLFLQELNLKMNRLGDFHQTSLEKFSRKIKL